MSVEAPLVSERVQGLHVLRRAAQGIPRARLHIAHATGFNAHTYRSLMTRVDNSVEIYASDFQGHGLSPVLGRLGALRSWKLYEQDLMRVLDHIEGEIVLVGHSMGAVVSMQVAIKLPQRVKALVLIEPVMMDPRKAPWIGLAQLFGLTSRIPIARSAVQRRHRFTSSKEALEHFEGKGAFKTWPLEWIEDYLRHGLMQGDEDFYLSCDPRWESRTFAKVRVRSFEGLSELHCPTTLIVGGEGSTCSRHCREIFVATKPDTRLVEFSEGSHFLPMEYPAEICEEIERLL